MVCLAQTTPLQPAPFQVRWTAEAGGLRGRGWGCRMQCGLQVLQGWACDFCFQDKSGMNWGETFCRACSMNSETHGFPFTVCWFTMIYNDLQRFTYVNSCIHTRVYNGLWTGWCHIGQLSPAHQAGVWSDTFTMDRNRLSGPKGVKVMCGTKCGLEYT
jgi:hypothetical protein